MIASYWLLCIRIKYPVGFYSSSPEHMFVAFYE